MQDAARQDPPLAVPFAHSDSPFRRIVESVPLPMLVARVADGQLLYANPAAAELFQLAPVELTTLFLPDLCRHVTDYTALIADFLQQGSVAGYKLACRRHSGGGFWATVSLTPQLLKGHKSQEEPALLVSFTEITVHRQLESTLSEKEAFFQLVLDNIPQLIFWKNRSSVFLGCNKSWAEAAGLGTPEAVVGKTDYDLYSEPGDVDPYVEQDRRVLRSGIPELNIIEHHVKPGGQEVWYATSKIPIRDAQQSVIGVLGTIENITERKLAEEALRQSERKLAQILEALPVGVFVIDQHGKLHYINEMAQALLGNSISTEATITQIRDARLAYRAGTDQPYPVEQMPIVRALRESPPWWTTWKFAGVSSRYQSKFRPCRS
ncbi:MAG TPA: PAS domain-containing protein [Trichocoleus sp.]